MPDQDTLSLEEVRNLPVVKYFAGLTESERRWPGIKKLSDCCRILMEEEA
jgi:hypothetical protein